MAQAMDGLASGRTLVLVEAASRDAGLSFRPRQFMSRQQAIRGCIYGSCRPAEHFPFFGWWAVDGTLDVTALISRTIGDLGQVDAAFATMGDGTGVRMVLEFPDDLAGHA